MATANAIASTSQNCRTKSAILKRQTAPVPMPKVSSHRRLTRTMTAPIHSKATVGDTTNMEGQAEETVEEMVGHQEAETQVATEPPQEVAAPPTEGIHQ